MMFLAIVLFDLALLISALAVLADQYQMPEPLRALAVRITLFIRQRIGFALSAIWRLMTTLMNIRSVSLQR